MLTLFMVKARLQYDVDICHNVMKLSCLSGSVVANRYPTLSNVSGPTSFSVAIWHYARPNKSNLAFFDRSWAWNFWFGILGLFGLFGRVWPWSWRLLFGLNVIFWLYFGLFYTKVPFNYHSDRSDRMCATPIFRYHTLTVWLMVT